MSQPSAYQVAPSFSPVSAMFVPAEKAAEREIQPSFLRFNAESVGNAGHVSTGVYRITDMLRLFLVGLNSEDYGILANFKGTLT